MLTLIRGAGEIASGIAVRLRRVGLEVVMTELAKPTTICRTVAFSQAVFDDDQTVENLTARRAGNVAAAQELISRGILPVLVDPDCNCRMELHPTVIVDAIASGHNVGTQLGDAELVIGVGAGFAAGVDCHAAIECAAGHSLGRAFYQGSVPSESSAPVLGEEEKKRILCAPAAGEFIGAKKIGDFVNKGETVGVVGGLPMTAEASGMLRGIICDGVSVTEGMCAGEIDPLGRYEHCYTVSGHALAVAGGVLEAIMYLGRTRR